MKQRGLWLYRILSTALFAGLFCLTVFHLFSNLRDDLRDAAYNTLWETATEQAEHIKASAAFRYQLLDTAGALLPDAALDPGAAEQVAPLLASVPQDGAFQNIFFADGRGIAYAADGTRLDCGDAAYYRAAMQGERALGPIASADGLLAMAVPVVRGQETVGALIGAVPAETVSLLLQTHLFDGTSVYRIVSGDLRILLDENGMQPDGQELLDCFDPGSMTLEAQSTMRTLLLSGRSGSFEAEKDGAPVYGVYVRLGIEDAYLLQTVPADTVNGDNAFIGQNVLTFGAELILIAGLMSALIVVAEKRRTAILQRERERLQQSEESYRLLNELSEGVMFEGSHPDGSLAFNKTYADTFGRDPFLTCVADLELENPHVYERDRSAYRHLADDLLAKVHASSAEFRLYDRVGEPRWFRAEYLTALDSSRRPGRFVGKLTDIDAEKRTLQKLAAGAERDPLTKLLNRASMEQQVDDFLQTEGKTGLHAFLMIDLDDFKQINDTYGHVEGDKLLCEVADRLRALFRTSDLLCRMGGDEFSIFISNINSIERIGMKAQGLIDAVTQLGRRYDTCPRISVSVGIALPGKDGMSYAALYRNADAALYRAKHSGKSTYLFYDAG